MEGWEVKLMCPICERKFSSLTEMNEHIGNHVKSDQVGESSSGASEVTSDIKDFLPWRIKTGKRSSNRKKALVAVEVVSQQSNPLPLLPPPLPPMQLLAPLLDLVDLPLKKRILMVVRGREHNDFLCFVCGKSFKTSNALGGHKGYHRRLENKQRAAMEEGGDNSTVVVNQPPQPKRQRRSWSGGACQCQGCGREFNTPQGLGLHRRHCKGPQPPAERNTKLGRRFDLNALPLPEEDEEILALPWRD